MAVLVRCLFGVRSDAVSGELIAGDARSAESAVKGALGAASKQGQRFSTGSPPFSGTIQR